MQQRPDASMNSRQEDRPFQWTDECQQAFQSLVDELTSKPLLQPYSLNEEIAVTTDAFREGQLEEY